MFGFLFGLINRPERDLFCTGVGLAVLTVVMSSFDIFEVVAAGMSPWTDGGAVVLFLLSGGGSDISGSAFGANTVGGDGLSRSKWLFEWLVWTVSISLLCDDGVMRFDVMYVLPHSPVAHVVDDPVRVWRVVCRFDIAWPSFIGGVIFKPDRLGIYFTLAFFADFR